MANKLKARIAAGKACVNGWLAIPSGFSAEVMAQCGWDSITVDMQHGVQDYPVDGAVLPGDDGASRHAAGARALERARHYRQGAGWRCVGIICPMVNNKAEAQALASYSLYPPMGKRSNGPIRAAMYGEASNYQKTANDEVLVIPMIETQEGIDNIDDILSVPGISGIYIGPSDMGLSLGLIPTLDREEPLILGIYEKLLASCKKHGKFAGLHNGTSAYAARMIGMGFRFVTIANDSGLMARMARSEVAATRKAAGDVASLKRVRSGGFAP